ISRFSFRQSGERSSALALARKASRPPRCSTDLRACAEIRSFTDRFRVSLISVTFTRFGRNLRLVLFSAWLRSWPERGSLPVNSQRLVMVAKSFSAAPHDQPTAPTGTPQITGKINENWPADRDRRDRWRLLYASPVPGVKRGAHSRAWRGGHRTTKF